jgi:hypothetical protein
METDPSKWYSCPVVNFMGFAAADEVFQDFSLSDFPHSCWLPRGANSHQFQINPTKNDLPICRRIEKNSLDTEDYEVPKWLEVFLNLMEH